MGEEKKKPEWALDQEMTDALGLPDVAVAALAPGEGEPPITTYMAILKFTSVMYVDHRNASLAFNPEAVVKAIVDNMRPSMLQTLFNYLKDNDSTDLAAHVAETEAETIHKMLTQNPLQFPPRG